MVLKPCPDRKSTRLNSSHDQISYAVFCLKKKKEDWTSIRTRFVSKRSRPIRRNISTPPTPATTHLPPHRKSWRSSIVLGKASFFFNDTATTEIYTLSLHDALPI